tara:strand:- start:4782 stop:5117 length:336 start_codon:yes stop_codon:yes gene_type:complete
MVLNFTTFLRQDSEAVIDVDVTVLVAMVLNVAEKFPGPCWRGFRGNVFTPEANAVSTSRDVGEGLVKFLREESPQRTLVVVRKVTHDVVPGLALQPIAEGLSVKREKFFHG